MSAVQNISFNRMDNSQSTLEDYKGDVILIVNVASKCGLTPQYEALEKMYRQYHEQGLTILGFPANNFLAQEPGTDADIEQFCKLTYDVSFPIFSKISVKGDDKHPLYAALMKAQPKAIAEAGSNLAEKLKGLGQTPDSESGILWNFEKFLINRKGDVVARFAPDMKPDASAITQKIEALLKESK